MMISVILREIYEEINCVSFFSKPRDFVNGPDLVAQSTDNLCEIRSQKYGATQIMLGNGYSVTNYYDSIEMSFYATYFHHSGDRRVWDTNK